MAVEDSPAMLLSVGSPAPKRQKREPNPPVGGLCTLLDLPNETLLVVVQYLLPGDLSLLSVLSHAFRDRFVGHLFSKVQLHWSDFERAEVPKLCHASHARKVRILDSSPGPEWNFDLSTHLQTTYPRTTELEFQLLNSSAWLKYKTMTVPITTVTLRNVNHSPELHKHLFDLNHLRNFNHLTTIILDGFNFHWKDIVSVKSLRSLYLVDCTWEYPFAMAQFDPYGCLETLTVTYTNNNPFLLLERLQDFLLFRKDPDYPLAFSALRELVVDFKKFSKPPSLNSLVFNNLTHFSPRDTAGPDWPTRPVCTTLPCLVTLRLRGWQANNYLKFYHRHLKPLMGPTTVGWDPTEDRTLAPSVWDTAPTQVRRWVRLPLLRRVELGLTTDVGGTAGTFIAPEFSLIIKGSI